MCFKNLPVEFDESGRARLKGGIADPYSVTMVRPHVAMTEEERIAQIQRLMARNGHIRELNMDPVTRVAGALAVNVTADLENGTYLDARSQATLFRGYEVIAIGRDPRDAVFITSRACGVCGGVHSHASVYAIEMAMGLPPPPMGTVIRNMGEAAEMGYDNPLHLYLLAGPDYSEAVVKAVNPELWSKAERWKCPQTIVPGGVSTTVTMETLNEYHSKLGRIFDYAQRMIGVWDDIADFFYEADDRYKQVGALPMNFIDNGYWDDPHAYDATYENCNEWGERRWSTPGVVIDGKLVTTRLSDINIGLEEFVEHSYYDHWAGDRYDSAPDGQPISPFHP